MCYNASNNDISMYGGRRTGTTFYMYIKISTHTYYVIHNLWTDARMAQWCCHVTGTRHQRRRHGWSVCSVRSNRSNTNMKV